MINRKRSSHAYCERDPCSMCADSEMTIVALHTHFNHPNEISWITEEVAQQLFETNITVRNQTVLLKGINDDVDTMSRLIRKLADNNIAPVPYVSSQWPDGLHFVLTGESSTMSTCATW